MTLNRTPRELPAFVLLILACLLLAGFVPAFRSYSNLTALGESAAYLGIMACGQGMVILCGGLDLSVGSILALCSCSIAALLAGGWSWPTATLAGLMVGALAGYVNGALITYRRLPPILTTLATLLIFRHGISLLTQDRNYGPFPDAFDALSVGWRPTVVFLCVTALFALVAYRTRVGRWILAIGGNEQAARLSGLPVARMKRLAYVLSGLSAGVAAWILMAYNNNAQANTGEGMELQVIAACVVGGIRITGGDGSLVGAALGAILIALLRDALILTGKPPEQYGLFTGLIILAAALIERWRVHRASPTLKTT